METKNEKQKDVKTLFAINLIELRKQMQLTQLQLAEKINYSDKAISKWERGESLPDLEITKQLGDLFGVKVDYFLTEHKKKDSSAFSIPKIIHNNHLVISGLSVIGLWVIATIIFVAFDWTATLDIPYKWLVFIYAVPLSFIVILIFNCVWGKIKYLFIILTLLLWSLLASVYITLLPANYWTIFLIGIPIQFLIFLWSRYKIFPKETRNTHISTKK